MEYLNFGSIELTADEKIKIHQKLKSFHLEDQYIIGIMNSLFDKIVAQFKSQEEFNRAVTKKYNTTLCWYDSALLQCVVYSMCYQQEDINDGFFDVVDFFKDYECDVFQYLIKNTDQLSQQSGVLSSVQANSRIKN